MSFFSLLCIFDANYIYLHYGFWAFTENNGNFTILRFLATKDFQYWYSQCTFRILYCYLIYSSLFQIHLISNIFSTYLFCVRTKSRRRRTRWAFLSIYQWEFKVSAKVKRNFFFGTNHLYFCNFVQRCSGVLISRNAYIPQKKHASQTLVTVPYEIINISTKLTAKPTQWKLALVIPKNKAYIFGQRQ